MYGFKRNKINCLMYEIDCFNLYIMRIKRRYSNSLNAKLSGITFRRYETCMLSILLQKDVMDAFSSTRIGKLSI